jgi:alcohol dehydrogenase class IV
VHLAGAELVRDAERPLDVLGPTRSARSTTYRCTTAPLNAVLLPAVLRFNETAAPEKYERLHRAVGTGPDEDLAEWVANLNAMLGLPHCLAAMGVLPDVLPRIAEHAEQDPSTETNARPVTRSDYEEMLRDSMRVRHR